MSRTRGFFLMALGCGAAVAFASSASAQIGSTTRGIVVDTNNQPIPEVKAEFVFKGETRVPIVKLAKTDKKGQYVRSGLQTGNWEITFTKAGYKPRTVNTWFGGDAVSDTPPVTMLPAAAGDKPVTSAAEAEADAKEKQRLKELGATYKGALEALNARDLAKAETLFKEVLAVNPNVAEAHHNLGYVYMLQNKGEEAEASFRKAIEVDPSKGDSYLAVGALLQAKGKVAEAYDLLNGVAALFPQDAKFQFTLGVAASNAGGKEAEALAAFTKASELDPANLECQYYLATLALGRNEVPQALAMLEKYVAGAAPDAPNIPVAQALIAQLTKKKK